MSFDDITQPTQSLRLEQQRQAARQDALFDRMLRLERELHHHSDALRTLGWLLAVLGGALAAVAGLAVALWLRH